MNREEAIQKFNGIINAMSISIAQSKFYQSKAELNELCDMAIKALSANVVEVTDKSMESLIKGLEILGGTDCSTCKHNNKSWDSEECDSCCGNNSHYESAEAEQGGDAEMQSIAKTPDYMQQSRHNDGKDLISRADAIEYIDRVINSGLGRNKSLDYIHKYISALPSADRPQVNWNTEACKEISDKARQLDNAITLLADRPTGEWIETEDDFDNIYWECSNCEDAFVLDVGTPKDNNYNYCPNCGAKMNTI